ncbi:hybrid sensor histidine kinase/response regulator transcription factor [Cecembia rubra]|uniref:histidine kinase n=1 Tax=Cecembia rubra TaxID=1485585 RepID=A0A2P8ECG1_9BACT|nr:hybrid sensor histidine kinase/response regulator transcription factor [Cecembia rubra]PSL07169.1 signal transduction histidine kinase [Cecembia rubra]
MKKLPAYKISKNHPCIRELYLLLFTLLTISTIQAQEMPGESVFKFSHYSSKDGLPQNSVLAITQDYMGFLWMGTDDGLSRFDGYGFRNFRHNPQNPNSINNNVIRAIVQDPNGFLWIGTEGGGINVLDPTTENFQRFNFHDPNKNDLLINKVSSIFLDRSNRLWIGTQGDGLIQVNGFEDLKYSNLEDYLNQLNTEFFNTKNSSFTDNKIWTVTEDRKGNIYIGTLDGGAYFIPLGTGKPERISFFIQKGISSIKAFYEDSYGVLWVGTEKNGVWKKDKGKDYYEPFNLRHFYQNGFSPKLNITDFEQDQYGNIWIGTLGNGLFIYDPINESLKQYSDDPVDPYSIKGNSVYSIFKDRSHQIWLGMYSGEGLNKTNTSQQYFEHYRFDPRSEKGLSGRMVKSILMDKDNNLWVGIFNGGLNLLQNGQKQFQYFTTKNGRLSHDNVQVIFQAKDNKIWIGTDGGGINIFEPKSGKVSYLIHDGQKNSLSKNEVWAITEDSNGNIWIGTANGGGLNKYNPKTGVFTHFLSGTNLANTPSFNDIRSLLIDSKNNLWIGTYGGGLNKMNLDTGEFEYYQSNNSQKNISHDIITCILEDRNGFIWAGTFGGGLNKINPLSHQTVVYREKDRLPSDVIKGILEDGDGQLWISTLNGLAAFNLKSEVFKNYREEDGLQSDEFNLGSAFKDNQGRLYFGGTNGMNAFYPEKISAYTSPKSPVFTKLKVLNKEISPQDIVLDKVILQKQIAYQDKINLDYDHNSLEIEFASLEFNLQNKIQYAYQLEGYDHDWVITDSKRRFANYANLKPGHYTFKVKAFIEQIQHAGPESHLALIVSPPWYSTNLAYTLYGLLSLLLAFGIKELMVWRIKLKNDLRFERLEKEKQEEINQLKLKFFTNISHELRTPLMLIKAPLDQLKKQKFAGLVNKQIESIDTNTNRLLRLINQLLDFRKQETGHLKLIIKHVPLNSFLTGIYESFLSFAEQKNIDFKISFEKDLPYALWFDPEQMEKVFFNLIFNAFKFTPNNGKIEVRVGNDLESDRVFFEIHDNGWGIKPENLELIFDRFFQANPEGEFFQAGTGIGLALSKNLVELHHGQIKVTSIPKEKTIFTVYLKNGFNHFDKAQLAQGSQLKSEEYYTSTIDHIDIQNEDESLEIVKEQHPNSSHFDKKLLIVEDNPDLLEMLKNSLREHFEIITARDGNAGMIKALEHKPDFIISDVMMPKTDGITLCRNIKGNIETSHIPVILLTAKGSHINQLEGYESGADDYITKPFPIDLLILKIKNILEGRLKFQKQFKLIPNLEPSKIKITSEDEKFLSRAIENVEKHIDNPDFHVNDLVKELGMSRTLVFEKFKALIGQSPNDFIQTIRLKRAAQLILESDFKISEIGYMVGFNNPKYFSKCFSKQFGTAPSKYKKPH